MARLAGKEIAVSGAIDTKVFGDALRIASVGIIGKISLPILGNIKIEAKDGQVILSTTNLELYVIQKLSVKVTKDGATTVAFDTLSQLVSRMEASSISITQVKKEIEFKSGDVTASLETLEASEFPDPLPQNRESPVDCDAADIMKPFTALNHAICDDSRRYNLMGINCAPLENGTDMIATNGARLLLFRAVPLTGENVIIPDQFVRALLKIEPQGPVKVFIGDGVITVISEEVEVSSKLIEGAFPNVQEVIPKAKSEQAFSCGRKALISALQTCLIFTDRQVPGLHIIGKGKEIEINHPGKITAMILGTELSGQPKITIRMNARWLIETLGVFEGENVRIQCKDENSPILIEEGPLIAVINRLIPLK